MIHGIDTEPIIPQKNDNRKGRKVKQVKLAGLMTGRYAYFAFSPIFKYLHQAHTII
jgi:hypothetical protein